MICFFVMTVAVILAKDEATERLISVIGWLSVLICSLVLGKLNSDYYKKNKIIIASQFIIFVMFLIRYLNSVL